MAASPRRIVSHLPSRMMRRQYHPMDNTSGVGVLDKAAIVLGALEAGPSTLAQLVGATGLARPTAHRLAVALEHHRLVARDMQGRFLAHCATTPTRARSSFAARATSASVWQQLSARWVCVTRSRSAPACPCLP